MAVASSPERRKYAGSTGSKLAARMAVHQSASAIISINEACALIAQAILHAALCNGLPASEADVRVCTSSCQYSSWQQRRIEKQYRGR